ncbi:MAG: BatD family protein [Desulforhopalus sp.]|nr:BatD family protein [Desulforhopalus sp.]
MQRTWKSFCILACLLIVLCGSGARAEVTVEAALSHLSFPVDQGTLLTITVNGASRISNIELPEIAGVSLQNRGQSSRINIINGSMSAALTNTFLVQAQKPGTYTIPPIRVHVGNEAVITKALSFEVTAVQSGPGGAAERTPEEVAFIRIAELADHYPGEIVPIKIKAYFSQRYRVDINSLPILRGDGVVMPPLREKPLQSQEMVNGLPYHVLSWDTTLSGIKAGKHPLSLSMEASLLIPQKRRQSSPFGGGGLFDDSIFNDPFFDSVLGGAQRKPIEVTSPEAVFNVIPLPDADQPKNFVGAIGDFTLKVTASQQAVDIGEPIKLTLEIAGSGNFDRVEAPLFPEDPNWKTYSPTANFTSQGNSYTGVKIFDQAIVAKSPAVQEIPPLSFSFFDPVKKTYITKTSTAIPIKVKGSAAAPAPPPATPAATAPTTSASPAAPATPAAPQTQPALASTSRGIDGLAPLMIDPGTFSKKITPLFARVWFIGLVLFCLLALFALGLWQLRQRKLADNPQKAQQRRKRHLLAADLRRAEQAFHAGQSVAFLESCRTAIQNQMGLAWNMAANAISLADLKARLEVDSPLVEIFTAADAAAYGAATLSKERMQDYLASMKKALEAMP